MANQYTTTRIEKECSFCGKTIMVLPCKIKKQHRFYCDRQCKDMHHSECMKGDNNPAYKEKPILVCDNCNIEFQRNYHDIRDRKHNFCSRKCEGEWKSINKSGENSTRWQGGLPNCIDCGKPLSVRGYQRCNSCHQKGELNWNWKGGVGYLFNNLRGIKKYKEWRTACFIRDEYTCQNCGENCCELNVHHIKTVARIIKDNNLQDMQDVYSCTELWNIDNGITLCTECHKLEHITLNEI